MTKTVRFWQATAAFSNKQHESKTLKGLCEIIGLSYSTAKQRKKAHGDEFSWTKGHHGAPIWKITRKAVD